MGEETGSEKKRKVWSFDEQKKLGAKGERLFLKKWPYPVRRNEEFKGVDFIDSEGRRIELKTDTFDMSATPNFFMERYSDWDRKAPGGPWQALEKGADTFIYLFIKQKVWFVFKDLRGLIERLEETTKDAYAISVRNKAWITTGYKVHRELLSDLYEEVHL